MGRILEKAIKKGPKMSDLKKGGSEKINLSLY